MFGGTGRRIVCIWCPRLPSERALRKNSLNTPFALTLAQGNHDQIYCLNAAAEKSGLHIGMSVTQARALCRNLTLHAASPADDARFMQNLRRWSQRFTPWAAVDGTDNILLDITGTPHLFGGEAAMLTEMRRRLNNMGLSCRMGLADSKGGAWALAHYHEAIAKDGESAKILQHLPVAALRLDAAMVVSLQRLGLRHIGDLQTTARAPLSRRFGPDLLMKLDQTLGLIPEPLCPEKDMPAYAVRMTLAEPIGLLDDLQRGLGELLDRLCAKLSEQMMGMRSMELTLRRVDKASLTLNLQMAAPLRDKNRILPLFSRKLEMIDSGFGIDQLALRALNVEPLAQEQMGSDRAPDLSDLITRLGTRIGIENIRRFAPYDSHWPERSFAFAPAASTAEPTPANTWQDERDGKQRRRPTCLFAPEPIYAPSMSQNASHREPPKQFQWRRDMFTTADASGPERIAPEWWGSKEALRDYWQVQTQQGRRLWLFHTPQDPRWYVHGEFA
jgi:protein ImuB